MSLEALQQYIFCSKYARYLPEKHRRETWNEAVDRVIEMHRVKYSGIDINAELEFCRSAMYDKLILGSQRALQFGGDPVLRKEARIYNCTTSYCDRPRFFQEALWLLLCGCGVGFSVQTHHVEKLPMLIRPGVALFGHVSPIATFEIPDTIEGWADALGVLMASYGIAAPEFQGWIGSIVDFDYSKIRPQGAYLSSGSGKAPGPKPLMTALELIRKLLDRCVAAGQDHLRAIDAYDVIMHASDAVLSGGVRRSATICLFSKDDQEMVTAKTGDWYEVNPQRGRSNNSAVLLRDSTTREEFAGLMKSVKEFGEPGFVWSDSTEIMYNPCVEIGLYPTITEFEYNRIAHGMIAGSYPEKHLSGWAFCNLCEINAKACKTLEDWERACTAAALLGTMQAGYTKFDYLGPISEAISKREALLGVSMTGIMDNPKMVLDPERQRQMAALVLRINAEFAPVIGVLPTARATCVKPAGTTSCILGTASGIHAHHAKRYFRTAQGNKLEAPLQYFELHNPDHVQESVWSKNGTDKVVTFCIEIDDEAHTKETVDALKLLEFVKLTQQNWVAAGKVLERCAAPFLSHNVSNTINIKPDEWERVEEYIYQNRQYFAGISLLNHAGDRDYPQAPFCQVFTPAEQVEMYGDGQPMASGLIVDGLKAFDNNLWAACACALGVGEQLEPISYDPPMAPMGNASAADWARHLADNPVVAKLEWVRRAKQFAERYFGSDVRKMTYCLKDVHNWKRWLDLKRVYQPIDWTMLVEDSDETKVEAASGCSGGKCEIL
jgi:ribonucleoside-diphosphate reductase alpha chain